MIELKQYSVFCEQGVRGNNEDFIYPATAGKNDRIFVLLGSARPHFRQNTASSGFCILHNVHFFMTQPYSYFIVFCPQ